MADRRAVRARVLADSISNVAANFFNVVCSFLSALLTARILGPSGTGLTAAAITLVLNYTINAHLGVLNAVSQRYPTLIGIGTPEAREEAEHMLRVALGFVMIAATACAVVMGGVALWHTRDGAALAALGLAFGGMIGAVQLIKTYYLFVVRARNEFAYLGKYTLFFAWVPLAWLLGAWLGGVVGQWIAMGITEMIMTIALFRTIGKALRPVFDLAGSWKYIKLGIPIWAVGTLFIVFTTIDRVATASLLGTRDLGLYGAASMAGTLLAIVPGILTQIMWPRIAEAIAATGEAWRTVLPLIEKPTFLVAYLLPPMVGVFVLAIAPVTAVLLPRYVAGVPAARVAVMSVFFLGLMGMYGVFLGTSLRLVAYGILTAAGVAVAGLGSLVAVKLGFGLLGVAWTKTLSHAGLSLSLMVYTWRVFGHSWGWIGRRAVTLLSPMLWIYILTFVIVPRVFPNDTLVGWNSVRVAAEQIMLLLLLSVPLVWIGLHRGGIASDVRAMFRRKGRAVEVPG